MSRDRWRSYLERFHADAPGVTERMLSRATDEGVDPYRWAADALPAAGLLVDLGCGSAPLADHIDRDRYLGVDRSVAELEQAARRHVHTVRADATALPIAAGAAATVSCLMALMLLRPLEIVLAEARRILRPDGLLVVLVPAPLPSGPADALRWAALLTALGEPGLRWPNPQVLRRPTGWLDDGFRVLSDDTRTFVYPIGGRDDAERLVASLYVPGVSDARRHRAVSVAAHWPGRRIGIPLRRVVARIHP